MVYARISIENRIIIVSLKRQGRSVAEIKNIMESLYHTTISKRGIQKLLKKYAVTGSYEDIQRSGRPHKLSERSKRLIRRTSLSNRFFTTKEVMVKCCEDYNVQISRSTVKRILNKYGLKSHIAVTKPFLNYKQRRRRIEWAKNNMKQQWDSVVFSDESIFRSFSCSKNALVRRFSYESLSPRCTKKVMQHGPQVHVWGCFSKFGVGVLKRINGNLNAEKYQKEIINDIDIVGQCLRFPEKSFIFQQDLAPAHKATSTTRFLNEMNVEVLDWPANSPDANPIENLWHIIKRNVINTCPATDNDLWNAIQDIWYKISRAQCESLVHSMPRRLSSIIQMRGYPTKY
jgi:transposase